MQFGNKDITQASLFRLGELMELKPSEEDDELYFKPSRKGYSAEEVQEIILLTAELGPDEYSEENGYIRFWWD